MLNVLMRELPKGGLATNSPGSARLGGALVSGLGLIVVIVFCMDISTKQGLTPWLPYFLVLLASAWHPARYFTLGAAAVMIVLIVIAYFIKPHGNEFASIFNRSFGMLTLVGMAVFIDRYRLIRAGLDRLFEETRRASVAKSQFIVMMSHELRTPLNAIIGFTEILKGREVGQIINDQDMEYLGYIHESGLHLLDVVSDLLDVAKIESGKMELDIIDVPIITVAYNVVKILNERASSKGLVIALDVSDRSCHVFADQRAIRQILFNLLANAIKFTPSGGRVVLKVSESSDGVDLAVSDTGVGIPDDQIDRILRPYEQIDNRYSNMSGGTGLGLSIVLGLTKLHGGHLSVVSTYGQGSVFTVHLPSCVASKAPVIDGSEPAR